MQQGDGGLRDLKIRPAYDTPVTVYERCPRTMHLSLAEVNSPCRPPLAALSALRAMLVNTGRAGKLGLMAHVPFVTRSRPRNPEYEARRLKRRFAAISRAYERAMARRRQMSRVRQLAALAAFGLVGFIAVWVVLNGRWSL